MSDCCRTCRGWRLCLSLRFGLFVSTFWFVCLYVLVCFYVLVWFSLCFGLFLSTFWFCLFLHLLLIWCYRITTSLEKQFCPHCGNKTLGKVSMTVNEDGSIKYWLSRRRPMNTRGTKVSTDKLFVCRWCP